jgi:ATP-dependent DNA helicase RecQ
MKILIVAKTRRGGGACVGGITLDGRSVRLIARDSATNDHAGLEYEVGEVWEIDFVPDPDIIPPHVENVLVRDAHRLRRSEKVRETILQFLPPVIGGPEKLFEGHSQFTPSGGLYIAHRRGLPSHSTMFWITDQALTLDCEGKRIRYRYPTSDGGRTLTYVGFQEPLQEIPAGSLLRVSLAHWWRPDERPGEELRCFVQLSGWFLDAPPAQRAPVRLSARVLEPGSESVMHCLSEERLRQRANEALHRTFGFASFLPLQDEVVTRVLRREDALVVMPTGGGKSLCYQLPAVVTEGVTVVVSPLVALMQDQIAQLERAGVPAACLNHLVAIQDYKAIMHQVRSGRIRLLYLAPETLLRPETLLLLEQSRLDCLAIDEAHCISEWGHDFRPEYRQLAEVRHRFPAAVCLALTATATARVRGDIRRLLGIPTVGEFVARFDRPNLFLMVEPRHDGLAQILSFLEPRRGQSGIIYCGTRRQADELCGALNAEGWLALAYHAGLPGDERRLNQRLFLQDEASLMVATVAFGMGINKANVRFVIHAHLPKDLESYYQEIGRAGRDGLPAECLLLYSRGDAMVHRHFMLEGAESERLGREERLKAMIAFAETRACRRRLLLSYFGESLEAPCGGCDNCTRPLPTSGAIDVTGAARRLFCCVQQTGQVFGAAHLVAILRGSRAERVRARGHDRLSTFGAGRDYSAEQWHRFVEHFIDLDLLQRDLEFGNLRLTSRGWEILNGGAGVLVPGIPGLGAAGGALPKRRCQGKPTQPTS